MAILKLLWAPNIKIKCLFLSEPLKNVNLLLICDIRSLQQSKVKTPKSEADIFGYLVGQCEGLNKTPKIHKNIKIKETKL